MCIGLPRRSPHRLPETGQAHHRQARVGCVQGGDIQSPSVQRPRTEVLDQHVELRQQAQEEISALRGSDVEGDAFFPAVGHFPVERKVAFDRGQPAQGVTAVRQFQLDHFRAHVAAQGGGERTRHDGGHVKDAHAA
ncbi:hypothetical protein OR16_16552 [Cupriavidus basilensis OR16]|uniref:Uncharacterized protein n=1 Tax=Cupriavidus basilensis OR16 TaxID=1127483 RepID=H1S611_9BURK|nr:hypothetical protein OR16_16552 [Cupriavidus basilensis OR16]